MSRNRASSISNINSKYAGRPQSPNYYQPQQIQRVEVIPPVYIPEHKTEAVRTVNYFNKNQNITSKIPKWLYFLIGVLILAAIIGAIYYFWNQARNKNLEIVQAVEGKPFYLGNGKLSCPYSFFQNEGKCIICPGRSVWSGKQCIIDKSKQFQPDQLQSFIHRLYDPSTPLYNIRHHKLSSSHKHLSVSKYSE